MNSLRGLGIINPTLKDNRARILTHGHGWKAVFIPLTHLMSLWKPSAVGLRRPWTPLICKASPGAAPKVFFTWDHFEVVCTQWFHWTNSVPDLFYFISHSVLWPWTQDYSDLIPCFQKSPLWCAGEQNKHVPVLSVHTEEADFHLMALSQTLQSP
jgi:hypothetical protein